MKLFSRGRTTSYGRRAEVNPGDIVNTARDGYCARLDPCGVGDPETISRSNLFTEAYLRSCFCSCDDIMRTTATIISTLALGLSAVALPTVDDSVNLLRRQDINFTLADAVADTIPTDGSDDVASIIAAAVADVNANPLPQQKRDLIERDMSGYSASVNLGNVAINAPLNCNGADTYMGSKMWNDANTPFLEDRCAAACSAQSAYNLRHPPSKGSPKLCQFYNTYVLLKNGSPQGQYW